MEFHDVGEIRMHASTPRVNVVIPNWNGIKWLPGCLESLASQAFTDFDVTLVDNGSTDGSVEWVAREYSCVRIITRSENGGFDPYRARAAPKHINKIIFGNYR
jgi:glycosyltransferase involved in cell wall biosynthesis